MEKINCLQTWGKSQGTTTDVFIYGVFFLALTLLTVGCNKPPLPEAASPPARLYADKCSACHPPFHPQSHTYTGWEKVVPKMEKKAEAMGIRALLSEEERSIILAYLKKHASKGI